MSEVKTNSLKAWFLASRPKTLSGAAVPVLVGSALAFNDAPSAFQWIPFVLCLLFAFAMQIDANFINDLFDYLKGSDREDRLGPKRACAQGWITEKAMKGGIIVTTIISCIIGVPLICYGGRWMIIIGVCCVLFAFLYTIKLSYMGLGDVLVLLFFGIVPVGFTYYVQLQDWTWGVTLAALACGLVIDTLLMINNFRDREQDAVSGKKTIIVRLGARYGQYAYLILGIIAALLCLYFYSTHCRGALLPLLYVIPHYLSWRRMCRIDRGKELNKVLGSTSRNILLFGLLLTSGLLL